LQADTVQEPMVGDCATRLCNRSLDFYYSEQCNREKQLSPELYSRKSADRRKIIIIAL